MKSKDIIFLIGAGCSFEADIPTSNKMIEKLEGLLQDDNDWKDYQDLYFFIKNTVQIGDRLSKLSGGFNIERLVSLLYELQKQKGTYNLSIY